jgi:hypothetical protein
MSDQRNRLRALTLKLSIAKNFGGIIMERRLAGMIGAAVLATVGTTQIAAASPDPQEVLQARSFAELLQPIPDATVLLAAAEADSARDLTAGADSESLDRRMLAYHHHHHHHHHWRHHHHHHHHHRHYY